MARVLIADDDSLLREALRAAMEVEGFEVEEAGSAGEALSAMEEGEFDAVLSDVYMPGSGLELLRQVRDVNPRLAVVLVTGYYKASDEAKAMQLGAYAYLRKPLSLEVLRETMRGAVADGGASRTD